MKNVIALAWLPFIIVGYLAGLAWFGIRVGWDNASHHALSIFD